MFSTRRLLKALPSEPRYPYNAYMNELVLDNKTYVSSKRAAEITGYAKDYVGQLCREGRVEARLVGRNWYILKSALEKHRFATEEGSKEPAMPAQGKSALEEWDRPRYKIEDRIELPSVNRLQALEIAGDEPEEAPSAVEAMQEAWRGWFSPEKESELATEGELEEDVPIAIHTLEEAESSAETLNLRRIREYAPEEQEEEVAESSVNSLSMGGSTGYSVLRAFFLCLTLVVIIVGYIGAGFTTINATSYKPVDMIAGTLIYNQTK